MRNTNTITCVACGKQQSVGYVGSQKVPDLRCQECGVIVFIHVDGSFPVVDRLLQRSATELADCDWTIPIILDAIACESLIETLHKKWTLLPKGIPSEITSEDELSWEKEFRELDSVGAKISKTSTLMVSCSLDAYLKRRQKSDPKVKEIYKTYGRPSALDSFLKKIFQPRNRIVHKGFIDSTKGDASECHTSALSLIHLLLIMDREKYTNFDQALKAQLRKA
jgi:DNA-directed RNA polymerase subunit RPC12/RpoP